MLTWRFKPTILRAYASGTNQACDLEQSGGLAGCKFKQYLKNLSKRQCNYKELNRLGHRKGWVSFLYNWFRVEHCDRQFDIQFQVCYLGCESNKTTSNSICKSLYDVNYNSNSNNDKVRDMSCCCKSKIEQRNGKRISWKYVKHWI